MESINLSYLKAHLSAVIDKVRRGAKISILDRKHPVAILSPVRSEESSIILSYGKGSPVLPKPIKNSVSIDVVDLLLEDRSER